MRVHFADDDDAYENGNDIDHLEGSNHESESRNPAGCLSKMMSSSDFLMEISSLIASEKSDYRYFNFQQLRKKINFKNTQHWAPLRKKSKN